MKKNFLILLLTFIIISCSARANDISVNKTDNLSYETIEDKVISWDDVFLQADDFYLVYFFSETCGHCNAIKMDIISYYLAKIEPMYFVKNPSKDEYYASSSYKIIGITNSKDLRIYGVPGLLEIEDWTVLNYHFGEKQILDYLTVQQK